MKKDKTPPLLKFVRWIFPKMEKLVPAIAHRFFIKVFFSPLNYRVPAKEREMEKKANRFHIKVAGKKIQVYQWGKGPVVLVVHGWAGRATQFRKFIHPLNANGYSVVGFDGPAHGKSQGTRTNILEFEEALKKIYTKFGEPLAIIAHSFGGGAVLFSAMRGLPVRKIINIASPTIGDEIINTYLRAINGSSRTGEFFKNYMLKKFGKSFDEFTSLHFIRHIKQPLDLLLVHDEHDEEVTISHALELEKIYPAAKLFKTEGLGHTRILKDDQVIQHCVTFIAEKSSG